MKYNYGAEFPVYEYEKTVVLSGKNGSIIGTEMVNSLPAQSTPLAVSLEGEGNDLFLHWMINCKGRPPGESLKYGFRTGTHLYEKSQADLCRAMFAVGQDAKFVATGRHLTARSVAIYNSTDWAALEHKDAVNTSALAQQYLASHPELQQQQDTTGQATEDGNSEYSVLPYRRKDFETYLKLLQEENEREFNGQLPVIDPGTMMYSDNTGADYDSMADNESTGEENAGPQAGGGFYGQQQQQQQQPLYPQYPGQPLPPQYPPFVNKQKRGQDEDSWLDILRRQRRRRRDVPAAGGPAVEFEGIHRQAATGSLAPPLIPANEDIRCLERELKKLDDQGKEKREENDKERRYT